MQLGKVVHPILKGDYPKLVKDTMELNAKAEGNSQSRLPELSQEWIDLIKGNNTGFQFQFPAGNSPKSHIHFYKVEGLLTVIFLQ